MAFAAQYRDFSTDKQRFFSSVNHSVDAVKSLALAKTYPFLANNRLLLEQELGQLQTSLKYKGEAHQDFWLYAYYCSVMLQNFYEAYGKNDKALEYQDKSKTLRYRCTYGRFPAPILDEKTLSKHLHDSFQKDMDSLSKTPNHISKIRDWVAFINVRRLHLAFSRLFIRQSVFAARDLLWFAKLDKIFGTTTNVDEIVSRINAPAPIFSALSVALFGSRFFINLSMMLKHTFYPSSQQEQSLTRMDRFKHEFYMRHPVMINDIVWASVNTLTNYSAFFNISAPVASGLTMGFLFFDVAMLLYRRKLADLEYACKKEQYLSEKNHHESLMQDMRLSALVRQNHAFHHTLLIEQLKQLEINRQAKDAAFLFSTTAAVFLFAGFSASLLIAMPAAIVVFYFVCSVGVSMYITADVFGAYKEKSLTLDLLEKEHRDTSLARKEFNEARTAFFITMTKNTLIPLLVMGLFAISWQAALIFTALYIGYECLQGYLKSKPPMKDKKTLDSEEPEVNAQRPCMA